MIEDINDFISIVSDKRKSIYRSSKFVEKHYPNIYNDIISRYKDVENFTEKLYLYINNLNEPPRCPVCGKRTNFINFGLGYTKYCSCSCASRDPKSKEKKKQTCLDRYGDENYTNIEKQISTCRKKYGADYYQQTKEGKDRVRKTFEDKYGGLGSASKYLREKKEQACLERYGAKEYTSTRDFEERRKQTNINKYNKEYYAQTEEFASRLREHQAESSLKKKQTCLEKYGVDSYSKTYMFRNHMSSQQENIHVKQTQTCLERYGKEYYTQTDEYKEKSKDTNIERYGKEYYFQTDEYREKSKNTNIERYGKEYYTQTDEYKERSYNTKKANNSFNKSTIEEKFKQYLEDNNINFIYQYKSDLYPFNCDFYFPDKDMYLEINGFWHHGKHPFDPIKDEAGLNRWKELSKTSESYKNAIETWTIRDPKKMQVAKENDVNLKVFYGNKIDKLLRFCKEYNIFEI